MPSRTAACALILPLALLAGPARAIPLDKAAALFREAQVICERDHGAMWGRSLCGPIMLVEPSDRSIVTNQADPGGVLKRAGAVFVGVLPESENISNTPLTWSGTRWTQLVWPPPDDAAKLAHELFHRIQPQLAIATPEGGDNGHLDTLEGRYLLQLEWRALAAALKAPPGTERRTAIADALLFRSQRYARFPGAATDENALELNEGVAEYAGVKLGLTTAEARTAYALNDLKPYVPDATFVRSFAYATGPAYGLLLDVADPAWRRRLASGKSLDQLLRAASRLPPSDPAALAVRTAAYDGDGSLRTRELARDQAKQARMAAYRARLSDGPVLVLPLRHMNYSFNPQTLQSLGPLGTVYPTLRLVDEWGVLEVEDGALMAPDQKTLTVSGAGMDRAGLKGDGWRLTLKSGWTLRPGARAGDVTLQGPGAP